MMSRLLVWVWMGVLAVMLHQPPLNSQQPPEQSEPASSERSIVPYQRVFLPLELLDQISNELKGYDFLGRPEWEQLFRPLIVDAETARLFERPPEIEYLFLSARLDGSNLVSSSSRLRFSRGSVTAETYRLDPWSLAVNANRPGENSATNRLARSAYDGLWGHDRNGTPIINLHRPSVESAIQPLDVNFPWTLRSLGASKPTSLQFSFSLPRVSNSCLVLSLPKQASIIDADTLVTRLDDWGTQAKRLGDWGDEADLELNRINLATDSRWLIELSGADRCRFTINFEESVGGGVNASNSLDYLVLEHSTDHELNRFAVTSAARLEIGGDRSLWDRPLRFQLPAKSRIRSLTIAGRDVGWRSQDGMITVSPDDLRRIPTTRESTTAVKVSYLTLFSDATTETVSSDSVTGPPIISNLKKVNLPQMQLEKSFVIKGLTTVKRTPDLQFSRIETTARLRPLEKELETQWEWAGYGTDFSIELAGASPQPEIRALTKITSQSGEPKIAVRILFPSNQSLPLAIELPGSWENISVLSNANSTTSSWSLVKDLQSPKNRYYVYGGPIESANSLDFQVQHVAKESLSQIDFEAHWLTIDGIPVANRLVIESLPNDWEFIGLRAGNTVAYNQLLPDEKSFITAPDTALVYSLKSDSLSLLKSPPKQSAGASITASLRRIGTSLARVEYRIKVESNTSENSVRIKYDQPQANVTTLRLLDKQGSTINSDASWSYNAFERTYRIIPTEINQSFALTADLPISEGKVDVLIPKVLGAAVADVEMELDQAMEMEDHGVGSWAYRTDGKLVIKIPSDMESVGIIADAKKSLPESQADDSIKAKYDLTIDGQGLIRSFWVLRIPSTNQKEWRFDLDDGWDLELSDHEASSNGCTIWIERTGKRPILCVRNAPVLSLGSYSRVEFIAKRRGALGVPEGLKPLALQLPRIYNSDKQVIDCEGTIWFPIGANWKVRDTNKNPVHDSWYDVSPFSLFGDPAWEWRPWSHLFPGLYSIDSNINDERENYLQGPVRDFASTPSSINQLDIGWKRLAELRHGENTTQLLLYDQSKLQKLHLFAYFVGIVLGALVVRWSKWGFGLAVILLFTLMALLRETQSHYVVMMLSGLTWGGLLGAIVWHVRVAIVRNKLQPTRPSSNSTVWDFAKSVRGDSLSKSIIILAGASFALGQTGMVVAQDSSASGASTVPSIFIPFDSKEVNQVDQLLVPNDFLKRVRGNPGTAYTLKSAKHQLKLSSRGMTVEGVDQLVSTYEIYVNEPGVVIEIPFKPSLQNFSRLLVDGREVTVIPAITTQREYLTWTADREGPRTISVYQVPRWVNRPAAVVGTISLDSRDVDLSILPAANAMLEVDSDPTVVFDVESQGAVLDKESGRYLVHLGALPSIRGKVRYEPNSTTMATRSQSDLTFDIELLLQSKTVLARTVLKAGTGSSLDKRLTIEADKMWEPIGAIWGNYRLVETRNGRLQYLKRYVFELVATGVERAETELVIYWALADKKATEAGLLFAECIDPVLRPRTLRFARVTRSEWNVEQITNWIPAINEAESLNWPELKSIKADQRATSLRVPQTGGGYLRRSTVTKNLQARIASRWVLEADKQLLASRIEFFGASNTDLLELELPSGFTVEEVTNRNAKVKVNEREESGIRYAQLVAERTNWENYDFSIRLRKRELPTETNMPIPWLGVSGSQIMEQSVEVAASRLWKVEHLSASATERSLLGQGEETGLTTLMPGDQVRLTPRNLSAQGAMSISQRASQLEGRLEVIVSGVFDVQPYSMATVMLEIPQLLANRWRSDIQIAPAACPITNRSWLKIPLDRRGDSSAPSQFEVSFSLTPEEFKQLQSSPDWLRIVNSSEVAIAGNLSDMLVQLGRDVLSKPAKVSSDDVHLIYITDQIDTKSSDRHLIRYWFKSAGPVLQVKINQDCDVQALRWNGKPIGWNYDTEVVRIPLPACPKEQWNEIEMELISSPQPKNVADQISFEVLGIETPIYRIGATSSSIPPLHEHATQFETIATTILTSTQNQIGQSALSNSDAVKHAEFWLKRLHQMAQWFNTHDNSPQQALLGELRNAIRTAIESTPAEIELSHVDPEDLESRPVAAEETPWRKHSSMFVLAAITLMIVLLTDARRFPLIALICSGAAFWLLTGLWFVFAFVLAVVCVVYIDMIWINRSNRRLVR